VSADIHIVQCGVERKGNSVFFSFEVPVVVRIGGGGLGLGLRVGLGWRMKTGGRRRIRIIREDMKAPGLVLMAAIVPRGPGRVGERTGECTDRRQLVLNARAQPLCALLGRLGPSPRPVPGWRLLQKTGDVHLTPFSISAPTAHESKCTFRHTAGPVSYVRV